MTMNFLRELLLSQQTKRRSQKKENTTTTQKQENSLTRTKRKQKPLFSLPTNHLPLEFSNDLQETTHQNDMEQDLTSLPSNFQDFLLSMKDPKQ